MDERLHHARNLWLATVRANGKPHLVPVWFVWVEGCVYVCTPRDSVKARNVQHNPHVTFALEDGDRPLIGVGEARFVAPPPPPVVAAFRRKYDWDITSDTSHDALIAIQPARWLHW